MEQQYLAHYGVKGMKWGQRRKARKQANDKIKSTRKTKDQVHQKVLSDVHAYSKKNSSQSALRKYASSQTKKINAVEKEYHKAMVNRHGKRAPLVAATSYNFSTSLVGGAALASVLGSTVAIAKRSPKMLLGSIGVSAALAVAGATSFRYGGHDAEIARGNYTTTDRVLAEIADDVGA